MYADVIIEANGTVNVNNNGECLFAILKHSLRHSPYYIFIVMTTNGIVLGEYKNKIPKLLQLQHIARKKTGGASAMRVVRLHLEQMHVALKKLLTELIIPANCTALILAGNTSDYYLAMALEFLKLKANFNVDEMVHQIHTTETNLITCFDSVLQQYLKKI